MVNAVRKRISSIAAMDKIPVMLGGEHSISFGAVDALKEKYPELMVLQLDAHADLRDSYQGSPYSHAFVARRISGICPLVQVGIRRMSKEEGDFLPTSKVKSYSSDFVLENKDWCETICKEISGDVFISIDLGRL
jgi:agmatinase